jgi:hypothetical protein
LILMQIHPSRFTEFILIVIGLGMLVFAVVLNHLHPRNAGVATAAHGSISVLALNLRQTTPQTSSPIASAVPNAIKIDEQFNTADRNQAEEKQLARAVATETAAYSIMTALDRCAQLDEQHFAQINKIIDESYQTYLSNKQAVTSRDSQANVNQNLKADNYYKVYLNVLDSTYASYQLQQLSQHCPPLQPAPAPQPR